MKKINIFISTLAVMALTSCSRFTPSYNHIESLIWSNLKNDGEGLDFVSTKFANYSLAFDYEAFELNMKEASNLANNGGNLRKFASYTNSAISYGNSLNSKTSIARTAYYASGDERDYKIYASLHEAQSTFYSWYSTFLKEVRDGPSNDIYNWFYADMSKAEIEEMIEEYAYDENIASLNLAISQIEDEQETLYNNFSNARRSGEIITGDAQYIAYMNNSLNNFRRLVEKGNLLAASYGYDNYLDFVYKEYYKREYKYDFIEEYAPLINDYVLPAIKYYEDNVDNSILDNSSKKLIYTLYKNSNIADARCFQGDIFDSYVDNKIGGAMHATYNHLKSDGYYCFSNSDSSLSTAYVSTLSGSEPVIYFSKNYQNVTTIIHEFGHYFASYTNKNNNNFPFDIEETHSQANEMLFNRYLLEYYNGKDNYDIYKYIADTEVYDMLRSSAYTFATAEVEAYVFNHLDLNNDEIIAGADEIMNKYNNLVYSAYWCTPIVSSTGYYISYATSGVASLASYVFAKQDFNKAIEDYLKFVAYPEEDYNIDAFFTYSGLYSPLKEDTFKLFTHDNLFSF